MTQSLDLNKMGLTPMTEFEMVNVDGGGWLSWLGGALMVIGTLLCPVIGVATLLFDAAGIYAFNEDPTGYGKQ